VKKEDANNPSQILPTNNNLLCVERRGLSELPQEQAHLARRHRRLASLAHLATPGTAI